MNFLKGISLGLVGFLLFFALFLICLSSTINVTLLNPHFMVAEVERLDPSSATQEVLAEQIPLEEPYITAIDETIVDLKPWIDRQINDIIFACYDYFLGQAESIDLNISIETLKSVLVNNLTKAYLQSPPPEYLQLSPSEKNRYLANLQQQAMDLFPASIEVNFDTFGPEVKHIFEQVRKAVTYFRIGYYVLLGISIVMISLIVFILRHLKIICRSLGIVFILIGTLSGASLLILKNIADPEMFSYGIIPQLQTWAPLVVRDISFPMALFGISFGAVGAILLAVSFIRIKPVRVE